MFCEKCGNRLEAGERFCPVCGTMAPESNFAPQTAAFGQPQMQPAFAGAALTAGKSKSRFNIPVLITSVLMFISTLMPFVSINLGKLAELAQEYAGEYMPDYLQSFKYNFYQLISLGRDYVYDYRYLFIGLLIFVLLTIAVAVLSGFLNKKALLVTSGALSAICVLMTIAYMIYMSRMLAMMNAELSDYLGEFASLLGGSMKIKSINGIGLYLFLIVSAAQTFFSFRGASKK